MSMSRKTTKLQNANLLFHRSKFEVNAQRRISKKFSGVSCRGQGSAEVLQVVIRSVPCNMTPFQSASTILQTCAVYFQGLLHGSSVHVRSVYTRSAFRSAGLSVSSVIYGVASWRVAVRAVTGGAIFPSKILTRDIRFPVSPTGVHMEVSCVVKYS